MGQYFHSKTSAVKRALVSNMLEVQGCHTQARTLDELMKRTKEAIKLCLKADAEISAEKFVGIQKLAA